MAKTEKRILIEKMQQELKVQNIRNKCRQFDIRIMELEEEIERLGNNKTLCEEEIESILTSQE